MPCFAFGTLPLMSVACSMGHAEACALSNAMNAHGLHFKPSAANLLNRPCMYAAASDGGPAIGGRQRCC